MKALLTWMNANSGALQAIFSLVSLMLTAVLVYVTERYVRLTKSISEATARQLTLVTVPRLRLTLAPDDDTLSRATFQIENIGERDVKLLLIRIVHGPMEHVLRIPQYQNVVLQAAAKLVESFSIVWWEQGGQLKQSERISDYSVFVECTDIIGHELHCYSFNTITGIMHHQSAADVVMVERWHDRMGIKLFRTTMLHPEREFFEKGNRCSRVRTLVQRKGQYCATLRPPAILTEEPSARVQGNLPTNSNALWYFVRVYS